MFLPLLVQYFSEPELKKLTRDVIELHHLDESGMLIHVCLHVRIYIYIYTWCMIIL